MTFAQPNIITINTVALTDEGRQPVAINRDERSTSIELANGDIIKYIKKISYTFEIRWENVASEAAYTVDGKGGRDEIAALAGLGSELTLSFDDGYNTGTYSVFVDDYNEQIRMRRSNKESYRYDITLTLKGSSGTFALPTGA